MTKQSQHLLYSLFATSILLLACIIMRPAGLAANDGLSYYGSVWVTLIPFTAALLVYMNALWVFAASLGNTRDDKRLATAFRIMAFFVITVIITPISIMEDFHSLLGLFLFIIQFAVSIKILRLKFSRLDVGLVVIEAAAFAAGLYYANFNDGLLLQCQVIFQLAFWIQFIRYLIFLQTPRKRAR